MLLSRFRTHTPTLIGAALLSLPLDVLVLFFRLIGLSRPTAVYAGLLAFVTLGSLLAQRYVSSQKSNQPGVNEDA